MYRLQGKPANPVGEKLIIDPVFPRAFRNDIENLRNNIRSFPRKRSTNVCIIRCNEDGTFTQPRRVSKNSRIKRGKNEKEEKKKREPANRVPLENETSVLSDSLTALLPRFISCE